VRPKQKPLGEKGNEESSSKEKESHKEEVVSVKTRREDRDLTKGRRNAALIFCRNFG
jgi:hypothetical protein